MTRIITKVASLLAAMVLGPTAANAQTVTGTIDATIELFAACEVNGSTATSGVDFGTLDFGSHSTFFTTASAQVQTGVGNGITIRCSPGANATLMVTGGLYDAAVAGSGRAMSDGTLFVPYDLYSDAALQNVLANGTTIALVADGTVHQVPIYGRALGNTALTAGTYGDTISVTVSF